MFAVTIMRLVALFCLSVSAASFADVVIVGSAFCGFGGGCGEVTKHGQPLGVPLPVVGLAGFGLILGLSLVNSRRALNLVRILAVIGAVAGITLILIQVLVLKQICPLCMLVDSGAALLGMVALVWRCPSEPPPLRWWWPAAWATSALFAVGFPLLWAWSQITPPAPEQVKALWVAGKVNVVEVTDFDCPHCGRTEPVVRQALRTANNIHFVRVPAPMPNHENARPAARAFLAARKLGKGEEMAEELFAARSRTAEDCRMLAWSLHLDLNEFDRMVRDPATDAELDANVAWAQGAGPGLPLIWVQDRLFWRVRQPDELKQALDQAMPFDPERK